MNITTKERLIEAARSASQKAYAPYSGYKVGAAALTAQGNIFTGCNVENASYGLTMCAERVALFKAFSEGETRIHALAVFAPQMPPPFPCGACRQVMAEAGNCPEVVIIDAQGAVLELTLTDLLPYNFVL